MSLLPRAGAQRTDAMLRPGTAVPDAPSLDGSPGQSNQSCHAQTFDSVLPSVASVTESRSAVSPSAAAGSVDILEGVTENTQPISLATSLPSGGKGFFKAVPDAEKRLATECRVLVTQLASCHNSAAFGAALRPDGAVFTCLELGFVSAWQTN